MKLKDTVVIRKLGHDTIAFSIGEERVDLRQILRLNPMAEYIFSLLKEDKNEEELVNVFAAEYGVSAEVARKDVSEFLKGCWEFGFIENI